MHKLTQAHINKCKSGSKLFDGAGLHFVKRPGGSAYWVLRITVNGRRRDMGLGSYPDISLAEARRLAQESRRLAKEQGIDPIVARQKNRAAQLGRKTLEQVFQQFYEVRKTELKGGGADGRWESPVRIHVLPKLGQVPIEDLTQHDIANVLQPIWHTKADTARKALNRINLTVAHAAAMGMNVDLQLARKAQLLIGKTKHVPTNLSALHYTEVPNFYATLDPSRSDHRALMFVILTACRVSEATNATRTEIEGDTWVLPPERTKTGIRHRVPMSTEARRLLDMCPREGNLFPRDAKHSISDAAVRRALGNRAATVHGFRSSFRTWAVEVAEARFEWVEHAIGHKVGTEIQRAYERTDFLEARKGLMERWARYVTHSAEVVDLEQVRK